MGMQNFREVISVVRIRRGISSRGWRWLLERVFVISDSSRRYSVRNVDIYIQRLILLFIGHCLGSIEISKNVKNRPRV